MAVLSNPLDACDTIHINDDYTNKIVIAKRGNCTFAKKVLNIQKANGAAAIIVDFDAHRDYPFYLSMSGDGIIDLSEIKIPSSLIAHKDGSIIFDSIEKKLHTVIADVYLSDHPIALLNLFSLQSSDAFYSNTITTIKNALETFENMTKP